MQIRCMFHCYLSISTNYSYPRRDKPLLCIDDALRKQNERENTTKEDCGKINTVVYLYEYKIDEIQLKSKQIVWSKILQDLKDERGEEVLLIPIAVDQDITSLDYLIKIYEIREFPAVVLNEEIIFYDHKTVKELEKYLD